MENVEQENITSPEMGHIPESKEMSEIDIQVQAQEHIYHQTLLKEKSKAGRHALDEVGRSLNAIAQRRRQYFLENKNCNTIRCVRQWYAWETKRNLETNATDPRLENAATRGIKMFLHRIDYYGTLVARFEEYIFQPLKSHYATENTENPDLEEIREQMDLLRKKCQLMLTDNMEIKLENVNHSEAEKRFPVISILPRVHDILNKMVNLSFQWRLHARYEQQFERIASKRTFTETEKDLNEQRRILRTMDHQIRKTRRGLELLEEEMIERKQAIATSSFAKEYEQCTGQIEIVRQALEQCKTNIENTDSTIKIVQQSFGKYKIVGPKKRHKLESSILKRTRKVEELSRMKAELERLENHRLKLDEEELAWLRGGYENAVNIIDTVKEQSQLLQDNLSQLEKQRSDLKTSYELSMDQVFRLGNDYEQLTHKYEYVKRLATMAMKSLSKTSDQHIVVKPNKITFEKAQAEDAYVMIQPKGVAMVIHNNWVSSKKPSLTKTKKPQPGGVMQSTKDPKNDFGKAIDILFIQCGYYVIHRENLLTGGIRQHMVGLSDQYHGYQGDHNSLLVVIVAQSNEKGQIVDSDGEIVAVNDLLGHFAPSRCPALIGKPKVFMIFLKVTVREPVLPMVNETKSSNRSNLLSVETEMPVYFEPEPIVVEDDYLVARVMYEDESALTDGPTFGGINNIDDEKIPWFAATFLKVISDQAGSKDLLTILRNIKRNYYDYHLTARSIATTVSSEKDSTSPFSMITRRPTEREGHVNIFIDHALKKKLYLMPGI